MHSDIYAPLNNFPPTVHREKALNMGQIFFLQIMMILHQLDWDKLKSKIEKWTVHLQGISYKILDCTFYPSTGRAHPLKSTILGQCLCIICIKHLSKDETGK